MFLKKSFLISLVSILIMSNVQIVLAAPPTDELNQFLAKIGWTKQDLQNYLNYYEIPLEGFSSVEDLKRALGTPINSKNLQGLMNKHHLSNQELNNLLSQFGDSLDKYTFIEDLDHSITFYQNRNDLMTNIKRELAQMGVSQQEVVQFFGYLSQVEENTKNQLDQMQALDNQMEQFIITADPAHLTNEQANELSQILTETFSLYEMKVNIKMNNKVILLNDLLKMNKVPGNIYIAIYSKTGNLLMDFTVPPTFLLPLINAWEELIHLGILTNDLVDYLHKMKYDDSSMLK